MTLKALRDALGRGDLVVSQNEPKRGLFEVPISDILATTRFRSREDLHTTIERYVKLYNEHLPQRAIGHKTPLQAVRAWRKQRPDLFIRRPKNQTELDTKKTSTNRASEPI